MRVAPEVNVLAGEQREEHRPERPDVGLRIDLGARSLRLLRRHERRGPDDHPCRAHRRARGAIEDPRRPEIEQLQLAGPREEDVLRLEVTMHDPCGVHRREGAHQLLGDRRELLDLEASLPPLAQGLERVALEQLDDEIRAPVLGGAVVADGHDRAVLDGVRDPGLPEEALQHRRVRAQ